MPSLPPSPTWLLSEDMPAWGFTPCPLPAEEPVEREKVELAAECCREILHHVNQAVRDMEDLLVSRGMAPPGTGHGGERTCT